MNELGTIWNLDECIDRKLITTKLKQLEKDGKIDFKVSGDILKIEDIDSKRMIINIINAKGRKDRIVPLSENILILLREYYKKYKPKEYLFNGQKSNQYSIKSVQNIYKKYIDDKTSVHNLRHSCFTNLLENDTDIRIIQKIAGHSNIKTTEIYTHVSTKLLNKVKLPI